MQVTAFVPMKAHSERVPNKNIRLFNGKPLYHWIVESLLGSQYVTDILIDTDSDVILTTAPDLSERVRTIRRPEALRGDDVPMNAILAHDVQHSSADLCIQVHSTSPLLTSATIDRGIALYAEGGCDSVFGVTRLQTRLYDQFGSPMNHDPDVLLRTQDLAPVYEENSALYVFERAAIEATGRRIGVRPRMFEITREEAWDIDVEFEFIVGEMMQSLRKTQ